MKLKTILHYFTKTEWILWLSSVTVITASFLLFGAESNLSFIASLIGTTALIFVAKGNPIGQMLMVIFSILYGIISFSAAYYGEMITYLCMSAPMNLFSLASWLKNPYKGNKSQVAINHLKKKDVVTMTLITIPVSVALYFILATLGTKNLVPSTISVITSFIAAYLTFKRSVYFSVAYAANDIILIVLWLMTLSSSTSYVSVVVCFVIFLFNDLYTFSNWLKIRKKQEDQA